MIHIIGCGGVGAWLITLFPRLLAMLPENQRFSLWDGDRIEARNLDRQLFAQRDVRQFKVAALTRSLPQEMRDRVIVYPVYFDEDSASRIENGDTVFMAVDNNAARIAVLVAVDKAGPGTCLIGMANEQYDADAWFYTPADMATERDPRVFMTRIFDAETVDPAHSCSAVAHQAAVPQTAMANMGAAWLGIHLWHMHCVWAVARPNVDARILPWRHQCSHLRIGVPA